MKILNEKTPFQTKDLRALVQAVAERELDPAQRRLSVVEFRPSRKHLRGRGQVRGNKIWVWLPPDADKRPRWELASLIAHEFAHNRGMRGERQMRSDASKYGWGPAAERHFAWAEAFPLRKRPPRVKKKRSRRGPEANAVRLARLSVLLNDWSRKRKTAEAKLARYEAERCRIERRVQRRLDREPPADG